MECFAHLGGDFKYFLFAPLLGEMIQFDKYFSDGLVQPPTSHWVAAVFLSLKAESVSTAHVTLWVVPTGKSGWAPTRWAPSQS